MGEPILIALLDRHISEIADLRRQIINEFVAAHGGTLEAFQIEDAMDDAKTRHAENHSC